MKNTSTHFTTSHRNLSSLIFFGVSFALRYVSFSQTSFANGWDGYFYINQVRSFMEEGQMDVPDSALVYPLMMLIQLFTDDYVVSYKLLCSILAATFTVSFFLLALRWSSDLKVAILLGVATVFSPHLTYFAAQYPKNLLGVIFFTWLLYSIDSKYRLVPIAFLLLNLFGHRVTFVLGFIFLSMYLLLKNTGRFTPYFIGTFFLLLLGGGLLLPGAINLLDIERFQGMFSTQLQFAPYSFITSFGTGLISSWWLIEIVACCVIFFTAIPYAIRRNEPKLWIIVFLLAVLIFPFLKWSTDGPALRFLLIFILLCPLLVVFLVKSTRRRFVLEGLSVLLVVCSFFSYKSYDPAKHDPPYKLYNNIAKQIGVALPHDSVDLIIAHKSLAEYIVYSTHIDAMSWVPEYEIAPERLWRVAEGVKDIQLGHYLDASDVALVHRLTPSYCLIREDRWEKFIARLKDAGDEELMDELITWKNPDKVRPKFLLKN